MGIIVEGTESNNTYSREIDMSVLHVLKVTKISHRFAGCIDPYSKKVVYAI
jgi:hypothetical protein